MQNTRKRRKSGYLSSPCSRIWYQNRNKRWSSIRSHMRDHRSRLFRVCILVFPILYPPLLLSPVYIAITLLVLILNPRCQKSHFIPTTATRTPALATVPPQNLPQRTPQILRRLPRLNAPLLISLPSTLELPSPVPFMRDGHRVQVWSLV